MDADKNVRYFCSSAWIGGRAVVWHVVPSASNDYRVRTHSGHPSNPANSFPLLFTCPNVTLPQVAGLRGGWKKHRLVHVHYCPEVLH